VRLPKLAVRLVTLFLVLSVLLVLVVVVFIGRGLSNELRQLVGATSAEIITENLRTSALMQFGIGLFIVSILTGVAIWLLVGNPLRKIAEVTERFGVGDLSSRIDADETVDEIRDLALSFNWMAEHLQNAFAEREKHIEELVAAQSLHKISEERLRALIDNSTDIITLLNQDGNITFLSPSAEIILGYRPDEVTGKNILNLIHQEDQPAIATVLKHSTREQSPAAIEIRIRHADQSWRSIEASYAYVSIDEEFRGTLINARDITQWKELQQQLIQAQKMEALGKLAGGVAHDFNNMLTVIGAYAEMLISDDVDEDHLKWIDEIRRATVRATKVTAQLLAFSRRQVLKPEVMNPTFRK
jgi:PAS domain S-box-containing protein